MVEPAKPFACTIPDCGMSFTNEDHLHVHTKKHDMVLQLGLEQKAAFVADQTPTPTRFIRNCEEVGLFQDLQNDNPFEEGFKRAMESAKHGLLCMEHPATSTTTDDLHTPQMFPLPEHGDSALYTTNNHRNITISRSSSDESGAIKEYETTTISKLTNEVTTISRRVEKHDDKTHADDTNRHGDRNKDILNETSVSYTNNVIKIRKDNLVNLECSKHGPNINLITYSDSVINDVNIIENERLQVPPIMSQKSYDFVVDNLTSDFCKEADNDKISKDKNTESNEEYTVTITIPGGKQIKMKSVDETPLPSPLVKKTALQNDTKEKLKSIIAKKLTPVPVIQTLPPGTFIPVTIINPNQLTNKIPIVPLSQNRVVKKTVKRRKRQINEEDLIVSETDNDCVIVDDNSSQNSNSKKTLSRDDINARVAASRRYRVRLKQTMERQSWEMTKLKQTNEKLNIENAALKLLITRHMKKCPLADDLRITQEKILQGTT